MKPKEIKKCKECGWAKLPPFEGFVWCRLKIVEVWGESEACDDASEIGVF